MDILRKRIRIAELTRFEKRLNELNKIDLSILGELKEIEKESFIIKHKSIFFHKLVNIDFSRINVKEIRLSQVW